MVNRKGLDAMTVKQAVFLIVMIHVMIATIGLFLAIAFAYGVHSYLNAPKRFGNFLVFLLWLQLTKGFSHWGTKYANKQMKGK